MEYLYTKKSKVNGTGLYSKKSFKADERIGVIHGNIEIVRKFTPKLSAMSWNWIGVGRYTWINTKQSPFRFINHSCEPNTYIKGKRLVYALTKIDANTELTMDYSLTEADPDFWLPGGCTCGSKHCRKKVGPIYSLPLKEYNRLEKIITAPFRKIFQVEMRKR